jgi:tetratricopeptide (TPR) repeat protein
VVVSTTSRLGPLTAMIVIAVVGWPSTVGAAVGSEPATEAAPPTEPAPTETAPTETAPPSETSRPTVKLTPEELEQRQLEFRLEQATLHWQEGERLYQNGRYAEAAVEFERSYAAVPAAATLYSVALSYERAGKPVEAVRALRRYLALPDCAARPPEARTIDCTAQRPQAEEALAEQQRRVGELTIALGDGVKLREVRVAGRTVPLEDFPLLLLPGTVDVEVFGLGPDERRSRPAYITAGETFTLYVAPFESETVRVTGPKPPDTAVDELRLEQRQRRLKVAFWAGAGLTVASGVVTAVTGGLARYHQQRFYSEKCPAECWEMNADGSPKQDADGNVIFLDRPYPTDHEAALARYRPITTALVGVTLGSGVATALIGAFAFRKRDRGKERVRARVRVGGSGLVVRW